jgi:hypothetical protein
MKQMMAILGAGILTSVLFSCTGAGPQPPVLPPAIPTRLIKEEGCSYSAKSGLRDWTTAQLQQRRLDLYNMVPQSQDRHGVAEYTYRGMPLPQQDEIRLVEAELSRRYQAGDKAAELKPAWPEERRHI